MARKKILEPLKVKKVGAPVKNKDEKKDPNTGFTMIQTKWIKDWADARGVPATEIHREMADMYITAIESQRDEVPLSVDEIVNTKK